MVYKVIIIVQNYVVKETIMKPQKADRSADRRLLPVESCQHLDVFHFTHAETSRH